MSLESLAEVMQINLTDALRISNSPQNSLVLHSQRKIERIDKLLELTDCDEILGIQGIINIFECVIESNLALSEDIGDFIDEHLLAL